MVSFSKTITVLSTITALWSLPPLVQALEPEAIYSKASSGVVSISSFDNDKTSKTKGGTYGSGVIISSKGLIITNNHVVEKKQVFVKVSNGRVYQGTVLARDVKNDLALLQIQPQSALSSLSPQGKSPNIGAKVYVLGNAFGTEKTFTDGIVSQVWHNRYIQYTAPTNPGNSGSPLLNQDGDVVGIVQSSPDILEQRLVKGISFAIPTSTVQHFLASLERVPQDKGQADTLMEQGLAHYRQGSYQKAVEYYSQGIHLSPNFAGAYYTRGVARYELGDEQGAVQDYSQAIRLSPNFAEAYHIRGLTYKALKNKLAAIKDLQQAATLYSQRGRNDKYQGVLNQITELQ